MMNNLEKQLSVVSKRLDSDELWVMRDVVNKAIAELTALRQYKAEAESQKPLFWIWKSDCGKYNNRLYGSPEQAKKYGGNFHNGIATEVYARPVLGSCSVPESWPTSQMIVRGCESFHDSMRSFGFSLGNDEQSARMEESVVESIFDAMLSAIPSNSEGEK